jgi:hypothetical protein
MRERLMILVTLANVAVLVFTMAERRPTSAEAIPDVVRAHALEIVDGQGRVRASLAVQPAEKSSQPYPETVLLRLITEKGRPAIKISTSEEGSGFMAAGPTGTNQTFVVVGTKGASASVRLHNEVGPERELKP